MSSLTAIASGVSYHLASEKIDTGSGYSCSLRDSVSTNSGGTRYDSQGGSEADFANNTRDVGQVMTANLDAALRDSFPGHVRAVAHTGLDYQSKDINRSIAFHESSAPSLDAIIRQRIQNLPKHLILTDDTTASSKQNQSRDAQLCSDTEIEQYCRSGCQYVPRQPLGLNNTGNTCYLNSVIQCILATGPLLAYISRKHSIPGQCAILTGQANGKSSEPNKNRFCGLCGISRLLREHTGQTNNNNFGFRPGYNNTTQTVPSYFVCNVRAICPNLRPYQQEDAHEFLLGLLSRMEDSAVAGLGKLPKPVLETNVIRRIFGSIVRSEVTCHACSKVSARDEPCFNLSVDVTCGRSLQQCLFNYIRNEELCGQNAYKCENCRQLRPAVRRSTIFQGAPILVIQFNRFSRNQKLDTRVEFPASFNLRPFMTESKGTPVLYRLYATVNHEGYSCRSGHYVAFTRRNGTWLSHNDSFVNSTNPDHVLRQSPYLLFYEALEPTSTSCSTHTASSCATTPNGKLKAQGSIPLSTNPAITIPISQIPLPAQSPPIAMANNSKPAASPTQAPNSCSSTPNKQQPPPPVSSVPRIVFNQSVVRKFPQPLTPGPAKSLLVPSTSSVKDNLPRPNPALCSGSLAIRKFLYGEPEPPGLWTERPTPALNGSPLEKPTLNSPISTAKSSGQNNSFGLCKRKRSPSSPNSSQSSKKASPPDNHHVNRDFATSPRRSNDRSSRSVSVKHTHTNGSHRSSPHTPVRSPVRPDDRSRNRPRSVSRKMSHSKHRSHRRHGPDTSFSLTSSGGGGGGHRSEHVGRRDRDYQHESPNWRYHKHRKLGDRHHGHHRNSNYRKHSHHPYR